MKKLFLLVTAAVAVVSCSKEKQLAKTLNGTWNVKSVTYNASPNIGGLTTTINGTGSSVGGTISFDRKALTSNFNVAFSTQPTTGWRNFPGACNSCNFKWNWNIYQHRRCCNHYPYGYCSNSYVCDSFQQQNNHDLENNYHNKFKFGRSVGSCSG